MYKLYILDTQLFSKVSLITFLILLSLTLIVVINPSIVSHKWAPYLFVGLFSLITFEIINIFWKQDDESRNRNRNIFSYLGIVLFSFFIMYDTKTIIVEANNCINHFICT